MNARRRRVAVFLPTGPAYFSRVFQGIGAYMRSRHTWTIAGWPTNFYRTDDELRRIIQRERIDGIIAGANVFWASVIARGGPAFVNVEYNIFPTIPRVGVDEDAVARLAAEHFRERGFRHVAAVAQQNVPASTQRIDGFIEAVSHWCPEPVHVHQAPHASIPVEPLVKWLLALPRPVGIFCWHDDTAKIVHQACEDQHLRIPEDVALLGVDNDDSLCGFLNPPLSSIDINAHQVGYEAAALLDRLMDGQPPPPQPILVSPVGVVARLSSEMLAIDDPDVVEAIRFIRHNASRGIRVKDVLDHVAVSRRSLETRFRAAIGRTPRQEIHRVIVERAQSLLATTDLSIPAIAERCGYPRPNHFTVMFRKQSGQTPTEYRRQTRLTE